MGRYAYEVLEPEVRGTDPAAPYIAEAHRKRREALARKAAGKPESEQLRKEANESLAAASRWRRRQVAAEVEKSNAKATQCSTEVAAASTVEWPVAALTVDLSSKQEVYMKARNILEALAPGQCLAFADLDSFKAARAVIHGLAHHLKLRQSKRRSKEGKMLLCVENPVASQKEAMVSEHRAVSASGTPDATDPRRRRWGRKDCVTCERTSCEESEQVDMFSEQNSDDVVPLAEVEKRVISSHQGLAPKGNASNICKTGERICIVWLRDDMRLHDNPPLLQAAQNDFKWVVPLYIHDDLDGNPWPTRGAALIWKHESLQAFEASLKAIGSHLIVRRGDPAVEIISILKSLHSFPICEQSGVPLVTFSRRCEPWLVKRDDDIVCRLRASGVTVQTHPANVLFEPWDLRPIERWQNWRARVRREGAAQGIANAGQPRCQDTEHISGFGSFCFLRHALEEAGEPLRPCATVLKVPPCPVLLSLSVSDLGYGLSLGRGFSSRERQSVGNSVGHGEKHDDWAAPIRSHWQPGEQAALRRLDNFLDECMCPGVFEGRQRLLADKSNTSELSPYIRFGELSVRTAFWSARRRTEKTHQWLFKEDLFKGLHRSNATFLR
eukprot:gnl/TRDRNA2_/TRDRNA2_168574_c2_seq2.p1 gnl/TRDRNA2_/TRDRNA2_168574_c2~~gnl/TRDRNA2_/TRDRNA2_168574_c2_seq2.p1  ORF type:complete len:620 (+),score=66.63 gnl/TRDRNA2_/TRDRNA2_168574_c2_seq2:29-1861(+)